MHVAQHASDAVEQTQSPIAIAPHNPSPEGQNASVTDVGVGLLASDEINEARISHCAQQMHTAYRLFEHTSDTGQRQIADMWRIEMEIAIGKRSAAQVARMREEQRARMQLEPGASQEIDLD